MLTISPATGGFVSGNSLDDLRAMTRELVVTDWNHAWPLDPAARDLIVYQCWRASLSARMVQGDYVGAMLVVFAACGGTDAFDAMPELCTLYLAHDPIGLMVSPVDGQRLILEFYSVMRADGALTDAFVEDTHAALGHLCIDLCDLIAKRVGIYRSSDPILESIDRHLRVLAAALTMVGTA